MSFCKKGVKMEDSEGASLPKELFFAEMEDIGDGRGPYISFNIPEKLQYKGEEYDGDGVIVFHIMDIFLWYLQHGYFTETGKNDLKKFCVFLHHYADMLLSFREEDCLNVD